MFHAIQSEHRFRPSHPLSGPLHLERTNLLEEKQERLETTGNRVRVPVRPYQIVTLRLAPA